MSISILGIDVTQRLLKLWKVNQPEDFGGQQVLSDDDKQPSEHLTLLQQC